MDHRYTRVKKHCDSRIHIPIYVSVNYKNRFMSKNKVQYFAIIYMLVVISGYAKALTEKVANKEESIDNITILTLNDLSQFKPVSEN